jgi:hypothetical protein
LCIEPWLGAVGSDPDPWLQRAEPWVQSGATHLALDTTHDNLHRADSHIERLRCAAEVFL